jgi:hypothetical protein
MCIASVLAFALLIAVFVSYCHRAYGMNGLARHEDFDTKDGAKVKIVRSLQRSGRMCTWLTISAPAISRVPFRITRENTVDRLCTGLGVSRELQLGDGDLDASIYIESDNHAFAEAIATSKELTEGLKKMVRRDFKEIRSDERVVKALWRDDAAESLRDDTDVAGSIVLSLAALCVRLTGTGRADGEDERRDSFAFLARAAMPWALGAAFVLLFCCAIFRPTPLAALVEYTTLWKTSAAAALACYGAVICVCAAVLGNSSRLHRIVLVPGPVLSIAMGVAAFSTMYLADMWCDRSVPKNYTATFGRARETNGRNGTHYYATAHVAELGADIDIQIRYDLFQRLQARAQAGDVWIRRGAFGMPWISGAEVGGTRVR